jgi:hypothetical protein
VPDRNGAGTRRAVAAAIDAIDAANSADPNRWNGEPLALAQGRLAHEWILRLDPAPSAPLQLAARAHHLRRWAVPRSTYPAGRSGYLRWRRDQKQRHATDLRQILDAAAVPPILRERAATIVAKVGLGSDPEVQLFEDAVCLTFIETQFDATADRLDHERMVDVVAKTLRKMSEHGRRAVRTIALDERAQTIVGEALARNGGPATADPASPRPDQGPSRS